MKALCAKNPLEIQSSSEIIKVNELDQEKILQNIGYIEEYISLLHTIKSFTEKSVMPISLKLLEEKSFDRPGLSVITMQINGLLEAKDVMNDQELEETRSPRSLEFMKNRARFLFDAYTDRGKISPKKKTEKPRSKTPILGHKVE